MTDKKLSLILATGEGYRTEFKEQLANIDKEMVAFANASGGFIYIGISDDRIVKGIEITDKLKSQIQDIARNCDPPVQILLDTYKNILIIEVREGMDKPYRCSTGFYNRTGPNAQKMKRDEIIDNIDKAMIFLQQHLKVRYVFDGSPARKEIPEIPIEALREGLINAVIHRDYFEKGANVMVEIYDDRVEITNPGGLPKGLKEKDFGKISILRNPNIANLMQRIEYIEKMGTGIRINPIVPSKNTLLLRKDNGVIGDNIF